MPGTFSQIYIQAVFAVKGRKCLLHKDWRQEVFSYMAGIVIEKGHKPFIINGVSDHVHLLIGLKPAMALSDLIRDVKNNSANFINKQGWLTQNFAWQEGYGAFSYSASHVDRVYQYILNQERHHQKQTFREEYMEQLEKYQVPFEERFLFDWIENPDGENENPKRIE